MEEERDREPARRPLPPRDDSFGETVGPATYRPEPLARPTPVRRAAPSAYPRDSTYYSLSNLIYLLLGLLEVLLAFRFLFLLFGANPGNSFVDFIYRLSHPFVVPFYGIFGQTTGAGTTTVSLFDPAILIAMAVYAVVGWALARLLAAGSGQPRY